MQNKILVTKSFLPPLEDYILNIRRAFENEWLTNRGELVKELEHKLTEFLCLSESKIIVTNNGTIPLQIALRIFGNQGEIITTPFSYVATTAAIAWEYCTPIFVDISPDFLTIDESKIEEKITKKTTCILATHVFGNPCNVNVIETIAKKYSLKVIYDAAHSFNVKFMNKSIFEFGDFSTCSFHATKLFHTGEGGAIFCNNEYIYNEAFLKHNFGHLSPTTFEGLGINAKLSELHAAMGLSVLPHINVILEKRKKLVEMYDSNLNFEKIAKMRIRENTEWNYSYYPIIFKTENQLIEIEKKLNEKNIFPRRYFYPSLNKLNYVAKQEMLISENISRCILCLPLFDSLSVNEVSQICNIINKNI